ncbi:hypothetical protein GH714_039535 [Hevea brasiliensis]|uniref:NPH3 domain-containing protein n=1 Tax=Hevea brasiliensis TaxID=3981 RepID=A0A6A6KGT0_HEVBR|nr:hypothetical protein GH714_039535 [Hevea brasiliensis]
MFAWYVSSELATDVTINVGEVKFYLHKAFEICAKFCYGMTVTLNAYNVVAARCAAEYLEMAEDIDRDKGVGCPCSFLLKLLKIAIFVGVDDSCREDLVERISLKLHEASVKDLLIPARSPQTTSYDVELVQCLVNRCMTNGKYSQDLSVEKNDETDDFVLLHRHGYRLSVGKIIDGYLSEIARDPNLTLASFVDLSQSIPESARPTHDGLYKAIDTYLKCESVFRLVMPIVQDAKWHSQLGDLRSVQKIFMLLHPCSNGNARDASNLTTNTDEEWEKTAADDNKCVKKQMSQLKIKDEEFQKNGKMMKKNSKNSKSGTQLLPSRSRRIFDKLWVMGKGQGENRSSETSGSSQSPTSMVPGDAKSSGSSSRQRRHSIS